MGSRAKKLVLAGVSILAALMACELVLRAYDRYPPPPNPFTPRRPELYTADPNVGYTLWPSRTTTYRYPIASDLDIPLVSNSDGFRNGREFDERDGRTRILVVGDSFVFGDGVRAEERLTEQLEARNPAWHVDNMGMTGWGVDLMIRALEHLGRKADPDVVVLAVYTDDFRRLLPYYAGQGFGFQKFELHGSALTSRPFPYPRWWERLRLVQLLYQWRWQRNPNQWAFNEALLDRFLTDSKDIGFTPVVIFIPGRGDTPEDRERRGFLADWAETRRVAFADLTGPIHGAGVEHTYIRDNWHWSPTGHAIAAEELSALLRHVLGDPAPSP